MARYKFIIQYDGTGFRGWQLQKNERTVQCELELALSKINKDEKTLVSRVTGYEEAMLFLNCDDIKIPRETKITSDYMQHIASSIGADESVKDISLLSTGKDTYLISCNKAEIDQEAGITLNNYFWHIFALKEDILKRLHFTYVFPNINDMFLSSLTNVLNENIKNLKLD